MRSVFVVNFLLLLHLSGELRALPCPGTAFSDGSLVNRVVDEIRWRAYWLTTDPLPDRRRLAFSLFSAVGYAGYCTKDWNRCTLYKLTAPDLFSEVDSRPFSPELASGYWVIPVASGTVRAQGEGVESRRPMTVGSTVIRDPLEDAASEPRKAESVLKMASCEFSAEGEYFSFPDAIRRRQKPTAAAALIRAIREQGLASGSRTVVIPFFGQGDRVVFINSKRRDGTAAVITAVYGGDGWWTFRPPNHVAGADTFHIVRQINRGAMVRVTNATEVWTRRDHVVR